VIDRTVRPTRKALRAAGLLPAREPEHHIARGDSLPPQPEPVAEVFGPVRVVGDKTLIPIASVSYVSGRGEQGAPTRTPVAVVEVSDRGVRVRPVPVPLPVIIAGILLLAWNVYWLFRTIEAWRTGTK
jgi:hypothetical protein